MVVPDIEAYDGFYKRLIAKIDIADVSTTFAMEQIKFTTQMPLQLPQPDPKEKAGELGGTREPPIQKASRASCVSSVRSFTASLPIQRAVRSSDGGKPLRQRQRRAGAADCERLPIWRSAQLTAFLTKFRGSPAWLLDQPQKREQLRIRAPSWPKTA